MKDCYGVDLDGTLAFYDGWKGPAHIGDPVPKMMTRVKGWLEENIEIIIFTARAETQTNISHIKEWLKKHDLPNLEITNVKYPRMSRIYDDRAVQVERNTGRLLGKPDLINEYLKKVQNRKE